MAPAEGQKSAIKLFSIILTVAFMIKIFTSSQVYCLPKFINSHYGSIPKQLLHKLEELEKKKVRHSITISFLEKCSLYNLEPKFFKFRLYKPSLIDSEIAYKFRHTLLFKELSFPQIY